jgi:hypothetical protein
VHGNSFSPPALDEPCLLPGIKVGNNHFQIHQVTFLHLGKVPTKDQVSILPWMMKEHI